MSHSFNSHVAPPRHQSIGLLIVFFVILSHLGLLALGQFWNQKPPTLKKHSKVHVQTIYLKAHDIPSPSFSSLPLPDPLAMLPIEETKTLIPIESIESLLPAETIPDSSPELQENKQIETVELLPSKPEVSELLTPTDSLPTIEQVFESPKSTPVKVPPPPLPPKKTEPLVPTPPPKPKAPEIKKPVIKKPLTTQKPLESKKTPTIKSESNLSKENTKKQKERIEIEKKQQKEKIDAEKKKEREKAEAEKKRQQELAEIEKKRLQEITAAKEAQRQREVALLNKAKENLAKMTESRDKINSTSSTSLETTTLPKELGTLQVDAVPLSEMGGEGKWGATEISYSEEIAYRLKKTLRLPDYGTVKIKLTLERSGKVMNIETLESQNSKNKSYVEKQISTMIFPAFGHRFQEMSKNTFVFTLQNDS